MLENKSHYKIKLGSEKGFGFVFTLVFIIICFYPMLAGNSMRLWAGIIALLFLFFSIFFPIVLVVPNKLWFKLGLFLGSIISPIVMGVVFFLTVTPTGIIMRLLGKDILKQKIKKSTKSYWIKKKENLSSMKNQF
jgi:hypothetical protein